MGRSRFKSDPRISMRSACAVGLPVQNRSSALTLPFCVCFSCKVNVYIFLLGMTGINLRGVVV